MAIVDQSIGKKSVTVQVVVVQPVIKEGAQYCDGYFLQYTKCYSGYYLACNKCSDGNLFTCTHESINARHHFPL